MVIQAGPAQELRLSALPSDPREFKPREVLSRLETLRHFLGISPAVDQVLGHRREFFARPLNESTASTGCRVYSDAQTHLFWIAQSVNSPGEEGRKVSRCRDIPFDHIPDPRVQSLFANRRYINRYIKRRDLTFFRSGGMCEGETNWFLYLYLGTRAQFIDPRVHMKALGEQFSQGGGMDPTLLQGIILRKGELINLKIGVQAEDLKGTWERLRATSQGMWSKDPTALLKKTPAEWRSEGQQLQRQLQGLPVGAYQTFFPVHATAYVKISPNLGYFFDPNKGVIEISGPKQGKLLYTLMTRSLDGTGDAFRLPDVETSDVANHVEIFPVTLGSDPLPLLKGADHFSLMVRARPSAAAEPREDLAPWDPLQRIWRRSIYPQIEEVHSKLEGFPALDAPAGSIGPWMQNHPNVFTGITGLYLSHLGLTVIPEEIGMCTNLRFLDLRYNALQTVSASVFGQLPLLQELYIDHNRLSHLPPNVFSRLSQLRELHIYDNLLTEFPPDAWGLPAYSEPVRLEEFALVAGNLHVPDGGLEQKFPETQEEI